MSRACKSSNRIELSQLYILSFIAFLLIWDPQFLEVGISGGGMDVSGDASHMCAHGGWMGGSMGRSMGKVMSNH